jgi:drug/metabolite transporter (DMT)-like permease
MNQPSRAIAKTFDDATVWTFAALVSHTMWGMYPVFARYLQTVSHLPTMALNVAANAIATIFFLILFNRRIDLSVFRRKTMWAFAVIVVLRSATNLFAAKYTLAIYVQIITMLTPFLVALLDVTVLREKLAPFTMRALVLSLIGTVLMTIGDPFHLGVDLVLSASDWLGIALAFASAFFLSLYMVLIRRSVQTNVPPESLLLIQTVSLVVILGGASVLVGEDWSRWQNLGLQDWSVFAGFALFAIIAGNAVQMSALKHLPASFVSSLMPWRFVVTMLLAFVLLGEHITSLWQGLGMAIVFLTITWYLWKQNINGKIKNDALVE